MAAEHPCSNCRTPTTNNDWLCGRCVGAVQAAVVALGAGASFLDMDEARQGALYDRRVAVANGKG